MATATETAESLASDSSIEIRDLARLTVDQYDEMARLGVLDDPRVELVSGFLVSKMTKYPAHSSTSTILLELFGKLVKDGWHLRIQEPIRIPPYDEPEPDLAIVRGRSADYRRRHPGPEDVAMVIEVSESSLRIDQGAKLRAYARAGIPHYWIVNLVDRRIEAYSLPDPKGYQSSVNHDRSSEAPVVVAGVELGRIAVKDVLQDDEDEVGA
jgi:Uma2 family endonuclease